jgi:cation diffusion facilitator CzcD-associated flavoprotein CzcO
VPLWLESCDNSLPVVFTRQSSGESHISTSTDVAIIGAGPYGLSIAAHLRAAGVAFRIFGEPMMNWRTKMPKGMHLKSDGFASSLYDPESKMTLRHYCAEKGIAYRDLGLPVALDTFWTYGMAFQKQMVPSLDHRSVTKLARSEGGFRLTLADGVVIDARRVIVATGISCYEWLPPELVDLPKTHCSHSEDNHDLSKFAGKKVLVIGRGASSTDVAAILQDVGAQVEIVSREPVSFHDAPGAKPPSLWWRMRNPNFGLGPNFRSAMLTLFPHLFRFLPLRLRLRVVRRHLGPAAVWYIREKLVGKVAMHSGYSLKSSEVRGAKVCVKFTHSDSSTMEVEADHVISGTGYIPDLKRLPFLDDSLRSQIALETSWPALSSKFESSVPDLYFVGLASALTFGPLVRFAVGARFAAPRISAHLSRRRAPQPVKELSRASS